MTIDEPQTSADPTSTSGSRGRYAPMTGERHRPRPRGPPGTLPAELDGRYLRNGPNPSGRSTRPRYHWFTGDGDGPRHAAAGRPGRVVPQPLVRSTAVSEALGEAPAPGERHGGMDTANTNVIGLGGRTFAIVEAGARPVELSDELDTIVPLRPRRQLPNGYTAHPKVDPATGELHAIAYHWALPHLQYTVIGADGLVRRSSRSRSTDGPMVHDCSITERWMVVYDLPVTFDLDGAMSARASRTGGTTTAPPASGWCRSAAAATDVRWFDVAPCYVFHPLNAYDDGDQVVLDVVRYDRMFARSPLGPTTATPLLWRWTIDTATGTVARGAAVATCRSSSRGSTSALVGRRHAVGLGVAVGRVDGRQRLRRPPRPHRRQDRRRRARSTSAPAASAASGSWCRARRRRRGRRLADQPRPRRRHRPQRARRAAAPPTRPPARGPGHCCPTGCRSASTATGWPTDRSPLLGAPGFAHPGATALAAPPGGCAA